MIARVVIETSQIKVLLSTITVQDLLPEHLHINIAALAKIEAMFSSFGVSVTQCNALTHDVQPQSMASC